MPSNAFRSFFHSSLCKWEENGLFYILPKEKYKLIGEELKSASTECCFFRKKAIVAF